MRIDHPGEPFEEEVGGVGPVQVYPELPAEEGLDPNRWFGQVEQIAARRIGRETVTYVSNIAKYTIAYRLAAAQQASKEGTARDE